MENRTFTHIEWTDGMFVTQGEPNPNPNPNRGFHPNVFASIGLARERDQRPGRPHHTHGEDAL